jgi:hypothetical protein
MPSFTYEDIIEYIDHMRQEAYFISTDYYSILCDQTWYQDSHESVVEHKWYVYPVIPYMQSMSAAQIKYNKDIYYFVFNVFMSQNKPPYNHLEDEEHIYFIAKQLFDQL